MHLPHLPDNLPVPIVLMTGLVVAAGTSLTAVFEYAPVISAFSAIGALVISIVNSMKIMQVHVSINSRMDQLLALQATASKAEGVEQGRTETKIPTPKEE